MGKDDSHTSHDAVSAVSDYNKIKKKFSTDEYLGYDTEELLDLYRYGNLDPECKAKLKEEIFLRVYFLMPYILRENYVVSSSNFNDAMQNLSFNILQAIEKFDARKGYPFVNYLVGYIKGATAKTFKDMSVIVIPNNQRKALKKQGQNVEIISAGVELSHQNTKDLNFDKAIHDKQLVEWLEEALSTEVGLLTPDERRVLIHHYGLFGNKKLPYREIAILRKKEGLGFAYSRLSQIHNKAIEKLKQFFKDRDIEEY